MALERDIEKEPAYEEYENLLREHPRAKTMSKGEFVAFLRYLLKYDKFLRLPDVYTMCGSTQMWNVVCCAESVLRDRIPGDFFEAGCWRGGMGMLMKHILRCHGNTDRKVWLADAWTGQFPSPTTEKDRLIEHGMNRLFDASPTCDEVRQGFKKMDLWDDHVRLVQGYFEHTLPNIEVERLAILRLDADLYNSTLDVLTHLYPKLSPGGFVIVDDYGIEMCDCKKAVEEYRAANNISDRIKMVDYQCAYWRKS